MSGTNLKKLREKKGFETCIDLSVACNGDPSHSTIYKIETNAIVNPGILTLRKLAHALGCTVDDFGFTLQQEAAHD